MSERQPSHARRIAVLAGVASLAILGVSVWQMGARVNHALAGKIRQVYFPVVDPAFSFAGRDVDLAYVQSADGPGHMHVTYGDESLDILATIPPDQAQLTLPILKAHADWFQILRFSEGTSEQISQVDRNIEQGALPSRLAIVTRIPPAGVDPHTWGQIWRKDWSFAFYEFLPEGGFRKEQLTFPNSKRYEPTKPGELTEGTWQFGAALMVMPKGAIPSPRFADDGLRAMGWTLPVASVGATGATLCGIVLAASRVRRRTPA